METFLPQLCDLALHEPTGDPSLKHALLQMSVHSCSLAFAISSFVRSVQVAPHPLRSELTRGDRKQLPESLRTSSR